MKCNFDCFNCKYDDCISDGKNPSTAEERRLKRNERLRQRYKENRDYYRAAGRRWYQRHKEQAKQRSREYYWKNRETILAKSAEKRRKKKEAENA